MPLLRIRQGDKNNGQVRLFKNITTIGHSEDCDIVLDDRQLPAIHSRIIFDGKTFVISVEDSSAALFINQKKQKKHTLVHKDLIQLGDAELEFSLLDPAQELPLSPAEIELNQGYKRLVEFSGKLLGKYDLEELLKELMDAAIAVSGADKGFLVFLEDGELKVKVARRMQCENIENAVEQLSDSIVAKVVSTKLPLIISDALRDEEFCSSLSVINLRLSSVMCVPLLDHDNLLGLLYVGNDRISHLFEENSLSLLTILAAQASLIIKNAQLVHGLRLDRQQLSDKLQAIKFGSIIGSCEAMREIYRKIEKIAGADVSVLITGETGTGKELIAEEIHRRSARASGPFVTINCGAIPENLLESELFGHVRGAFTGATANKKGRFQIADGGTLFLDEIGELPVHLQVKLLRVLQERTVIRVGDVRAEPIDIRVIAATNRNLEQAIREGIFREDLFYRLNVVNLHLPPLRERGEDILVIARYLLNKFSEELAAKVRGFTSEAAIALKKYNWPGNIRQLENHIKKAVILSEKTQLSAEDLGLPAEILPPILPLAQAKDEFQRRYINEVLTRNNGNRTKTAKDLDVDPRTIFRHLEREEDPGKKLEEDHE